MSKVIRVLEQMSSDAKLQNEQAIEQLLVAAEMDTEQAQAIINKDISSLEHQLDICLDVVCAVFPAEDDDKEKEDDQKDDESTEETSSVVGF